MLAKAPTVLDYRSADSQAIKIGPIGSRMETEKSNNREAISSRRGLRLYISLIP